MTYRPWQMTGRPMHDLEPCVQAVATYMKQFVGMKQCCKYIHGLCYKLQVMDIPAEGPTYIYGDNQSVYANMTIPDYTLKKKSQSIAYHFILEHSAQDEQCKMYVNTEDNENNLHAQVVCRKHDPSGAP